MFSTGSKLFMGLTAAAVAGFVVYGFMQEWGALGVVGLGFAIAALAFLSGVAIYTRDADVSSMDATAMATAAAAQPAPRASAWPLIGAAGGGLLVIGLVTDKRWFVAGVAVMLVTVVEWMVMGWADRASSDDAFNRSVRGRILHPLELPILGAFGLALLIFSFSRIMLKAETDLGPTIFVAVAALILIFGFIFSARKRPSRPVMAALCTVGALGLVGPGIWAAAKGERPQLATEKSEFAEARQECGAEWRGNVADEDASGSLAAKSSIAAEVVLKDGVLTIDEFGRQADRLFMSRSTETYIMFKNENGDSEHHRLAAKYLVKDTAGLAQKVVCTNAIADGKVQFLTLNIPTPSSIAPAGSEFQLVVPGIETATLPIEIP